MINEDCPDCGWDDEPGWKTIPMSELGFWQRARCNLFGGSYLRDQFGHTSYDPDILARD